MSATLAEQINQLKQTITDIESQRSILGDEAVEASLKPIRQKLADLESLAESPGKTQIDVPQRKRKLVSIKQVQPDLLMARFHSLRQSTSSDRPGKSQRVSHGMPVIWLINFRYPNGYPSCL
jgi:hypothetical protein